MRTGISRCPILGEHRIPIHQRDARTKGIPALGSGAIYPVPESDIRVPDFAIPKHWPRGFALDTGWDWTAAVWGVLDREAQVFYVYSVYKRGQAEPAVHAAAIRSRGAWIPGVGDAAAINNNDGRQFIDIYRRLGLKLELADKAVEAGIQEVWELLSKVVSGRGCIPKGGPDACVITAHDARTGEELWRTRMIPAPGEPGDETWGGVPYEKRRHVGAWMVPSFDPILNLIYVGTSVTSPAPKFMLGGTDKQHLYHNSTLALDADTGEIVWYYQYLNDHWDLDHPFERLLVDTAVTPSAAAVSWINPRLRPGERRKVVTGIPGKTGVVYTLDRETGEFLWATPTIAQNVISSIDGATGAVTENSEVVFSATGQQVTACPSWYGGKDWEAGAYSPLTNTMYFPLRNTCARVMAATEEENPFLALTMREEIAPGTDQLGTVQAISAETGEILWRYEQRASTTSLVATGGGLIFGGDANGRFRALDQATGEVLWEINLGSAVTGFPVTYAVDGRQYVAVSTGTAGSTTAQIRLTPELRPSAGNNIFVFALP